MGFLDKIFGKKNRMTEEEARQGAGALIEEMARTPMGSPDSVLQGFRKKAKPFYDLLRIGGPLHGEFRKAVEAIWARQGPVQAPPSQAVMVLPWETWEAPTLGQVGASARQGDCEIVYLKSPPSHCHRDAVAELEALRMLGEPQCAMAVIGEEDVLIRRTELIEIAAQGDPEAEDICQDLADGVKRKGLKMGVIVS